MTTLLRTPIARPPRRSPFIARTPFVAGLLLVAVLALPARAQGSTWAAGLRLGLFDMTNAADSYDAVYGDAMPQYGVQVERRCGRLRLALSVDHGSVSGERVLLTSGGPTGTGISDDLTLTPVHLTAAWRFNPRSRWEWSAGLGPSFLSWSTDSLGGGDSGSGFGGSAVLALRRQGPRWDFAGEARWSTFPGALDATGGVAAYYGEDDPGGVAVTLLALHRF